VMGDELGSHSLLQTHHSSLITDHRPETVDLVQDRSPLTVAAP